MVKIKEEQSLSFDDVLLSPKFFNGESRSQIDISTKIDKLELKIPIIAANMPSVCETDMAVKMGEMGGLGIIHRMQSIESQAEMVSEAKNKIASSGIDTVNVGAAIGIGSDWEERAKTLIDAGANLICIDVAHGAQKNVLEVSKKFNIAFSNITLMVGNFANPESTVDILPFANSIKVGVGGGSLCSTRTQTGCGSPTLQSVIDFTRYPKHSDKGLYPPPLMLCKDKFLIADGGIKTSGDIVKSLAAGACAVMLGSLLAGTAEAPGDVIKGPDGERYKIYRGSASYAAKKKHFGKADYIEGEETLVSYKGRVEKVVNRLCDGVRSGLSYCGSANLSELKKNAEFIRISQAGFRESKPHGLG